MSQHLVLLGDSIFDNGAYVLGQPALIEQLQAVLPQGAQATLLAIDGDYIEDVHQQLTQIPTDATDLILSVGGNDALESARLLTQVGAPRDLLPLLANVLPEFRAAYARLLDAIQDLQIRTLVCTIYDQCPFSDGAWRTIVVPIALRHFNDVIESETEMRAMETLDLCTICTEAEDYSRVSPIEPSHQGAAKIVAAILDKLHFED